MSDDTNLTRQVKNLLHSRYGIDATVSIVGQNSGSNIHITYAGVTVTHYLSGYSQAAWQLNDLLKVMRRTVGGAKGTPEFHDFHEAVYDITATLSRNGKHMVVDYIDRSDKESCQEYFQYQSKLNRWSSADQTMKGIQEILKADSAESTINITENSYNSIPQVKFADDILVVPTSKNDSAPTMKDLTVRRVTTLEKTIDRVVLTVEEAKLSEGETEIKYRNSIYTVTKQPGSPIQMKREDLDDDKWWGFGITSPIDFEKHPLNTSTHAYLEDAEPKFNTDLVYITKNERVWVSTKNGWILMDRDYVLKYGELILPKETMNQINMYFKMKMVLQ